jgi:catechol 2,3-dioxygenase-like lactoylglutathione lyase family enzyme
MRRSNRCLRLQSGIFWARLDGRVAHRPGTVHMHKSRLAGFIIDCRTDDLAAAADFWGRALGMEVRALPEEEGEKYVRLVDRSSELHIEVQKVNHPSRVHLDIETDDIEAEVRRLEALGARRIGRVDTWCVMEAPTGQRFCVVRKGSAGFEAVANEWR